jgi:hypothetical protein
MVFRHTRFRISVWRFVTILSVSAVCLALTGCGNGLAQVTGQVTLDGQPLHGGNGDVRVTIQFQPVSGTGTTAIGIANESGNYTLGTGSQTGIPPGEYLVTCSANELVRSKDPNATPGGRRITDPKYANAKTSGLKFTVQPGKNEFNIPLMSAPKTPARSGA